MKFGTQLYYNVLKRQYKKCKKLRKQIFFEFQPSLNNSADDILITAKQRQERKDQSYKLIIDVSAMLRRKTRDVQNTADENKIVI